MALADVATLVLPYLSVRDSVALACTSRSIFNGPPNPCLHRRVRCMRRWPAVGPREPRAFPELLAFVRSLTVHKPNLHTLGDTLTSMSSLTELCLEFGPPYVRATAAVPLIDMRALPLRTLRVSEPSVRMAAQAVACALLPTSTVMVDVSCVHRTDATDSGAVTELARACAAQRRPVLACACLDAEDPSVWTVACVEPALVTRVSGCRRGWFALHSCDEDEDI